jgi:hypothetical protein
MANFIHCDSHCTELQVGPFYFLSYNAGVDYDGAYDGGFYFEIDTRFGGCMITYDRLIGFGFNRLYRLDRKYVDNLYSPEVRK